MRAKWAIGGAALWSVGLIVAAALVPMYDSTTTGSSTLANGAGGHPAMSVTTTSSYRTVVQANGVKVLVVVAIPLMLVAAVAWLLPRHRRLAWAVTVVAFLFVPLGAFTIGPYFIPVALLLLVACALDYAYP